MQTRPSKWWLVGAYWLLQALAIYFITPVLIASGANTGPDTGRLYSFPLADYTRLLTDPSWISWAVSIIPAITLAQAIFVWPVRKPGPARARGWPLRISLTVAGLGIALLTSALILGVGQTIYSTTGFDLGRELGVTFDLGWAAVAWCVLSWGVATPLLIRFCRRGPREDLLSRVAARLFVGTVVETAAIIPLDAMVRKRESCYCFTGTYIGLLFCGAVGMFALGPAILLPVLARRRKRWYAGKCEWCAYDMRATPKADCCPECGMGWQVDPADAPQ